MLEELRKLLGLGGPDPTPVYTQDPRAVPQVQSVPIPQEPSYESPTFQTAEPQALASGITPDQFRAINSSVPMTTQEKLDAAYGVVPPAVQDLIDTRGQGAVDKAMDSESGLMHLQMDTNILGEDIQRSQDRIKRLTNQIVEEKEMGLTGKWPEDELKSEMEKLNKLKQEAIPDTQKTIEEDPDANNVIEKSKGLYDSYADLNREQQTYIHDATNRIERGFFGGIPLKEMMKGAAGYLGELWGDKAIQNALVYYLGARLMGYSGSGSGMAAGQVLLGGWDNQAKSDLYDKQQKAKADANKAIDQTKTADFWDPKTKKKITGYMSKDGSTFYQVTSAGISKKPINPASMGLVSYKKDAHLTPNEMLAKLQDTSNATTERHIQTLLSVSSYTDEDKEKLREFFGDGRATRDLVSLATREMRSAGMDINDPAFTAAIQNIITTAMDEQVSGQRTGNYDETIKSMYGDWRESQLTADFSGKGDIPKFVYGKATSWKSDGTPDGYDTKFKATATNKATFNNNLMKLVSRLVTRNKDLTEEQALIRITPIRVTQEMARIFKSTVMKSKVAREFWTQQAEKVGSNAFMLWMREGGEDNEDKYMGLNTSLINGMTEKVKF